jgi:hypothetical protein
VWAGIKPSGFSARIARERPVKPPGSNLIRGALAPIWSYGEALALAGSHPGMVIQALLRSWLSTMVLSLRPLARSRVQEPRQLPSSRSSAPSGYRNTWGQGWCEFCTAFRQARRNRGASLCHRHYTNQSIWNLALSELLPQTQPQGLYGGHHHGIPSQDCGRFSPVTSPPNPMEVPTVPYENMFHPLSSDRLRPPAQRRARGLLLG